MAAPLDVDREQVRMLVLAVGCTEAAKQTGIPLNTVLSWSARGEWLKPLVQVLPPTVQPRAINAIKPADALANTLKEHENEMRLGLSKWGSKSAKRLGELDPDEAIQMAPAAKMTADVFSKLCPEKQQGNQATAVIVSVNVLGGLAQYSTEQAVYDLADEQAGEDSQEP